jgi:4-hydroxybenzoate polyprenyltransferase
VRAYLELLRPANVATALADVLAGFAVAGLGDSRPLAWLLPATAALYGGGVVLNDFFDRNLDAVERPERPIPSRRVPAWAAAALGGILLALGTLLAWRANPAAGRLALGIAGLVLLYDSWGKRHALVGPVNMGGCRALNLLLGVAALPAALPQAWPLGLLSLVYIAAVTAVSRGEVLGGSRRVAGGAILAISAVLAALLALAFRGASLAGLALTALLGWRVLPAFWRAYNETHPGSIRHAVRRGVLSLVLLDAVIGAVFGGALYCLLILATALLAGWLARLFAVT